MQIVLRTKAFISYSHRDARHLERLHVHLAYYIRNGLVDAWDDTKILPGTAWREELYKAILSAKVAILLVSADFLASRFIAENELPPLLVAAQTDGAIILPVILSPCRFTDTEISVFQAVNTRRWPTLSRQKNWRK
jgi:TIR domain-containing protein